VAVRTALGRSPRGVLWSFAEEVDFGVLGLPKRLLVGRPLRSEYLGDTLLPKKLALPVFCSDPLSSNAYATEEILLMLSLGGLALLHLTPWVAAVVIALLVVVVVSYRQTCHAYPNGGGAYTVSRENLSHTASLVAASALLVDYVLTVAVSVAAGVANIVSAMPALGPHAVGVSSAMIAVLTLMNLRGVKESGTAFAVPTYGFIGVVLIMIALGLTRMAGGETLQAESAPYEVAPETTLTGLAVALLAMRAFASGCTALTGVEAVSNAQVAGAVFGGYHSVGFFAVQAFTAAILILAANTAFNGFPILASLLGHDGFLPRQFARRGDRLVFSNGIVILAVLAGLLIWAFDANTTRLIQLYIIGVFVSFTLSQAGMVVHWTRELRWPIDRAARRRMLRSRVINAVGAVFTGLVLIVVLITKFAHGAWIVVIAIPALFLLMTGIRRHYDRVAEELRPPPAGVTLPARVHGVVLVSTLHRPTLRALAFARAIRPTTLLAVTVRTDPAETEQLIREWAEREVPVPLTVLDSPYRDVTRPVVDYVKHIPRESPRDVVCVFIPEYVVGHWWEHLLHNQSALRLKARLLFQPGVMMTNVPWQLGSAELLEARRRETVPDRPTDELVGTP
jgi:amino acid transporter